MINNLLYVTIGATGYAVVAGDISLMDMAIKAHVLYWQAVEFVANTIPLFV